MTWFRRNVPPEAPVGPESVVLFRLGRGCCHACPMCTTMAGPEAPDHPREELLERVARLGALGVRRVALTGGEPLVHPALLEVVEALRERGIAWELHTNGRELALSGLAERLAEEGLGRALVSFHCHVPEVADALAGDRTRTVETTSEGIRQLLEAGVRVTVSAVLTTLTVPHLDAHFAYCRAHFGDVVVKYAFPNLVSRGRDFAPVALRYDEVRGPLRRLLAAARGGGRVAFESVPSCVLGDPTVGHAGRAAYGETHYLDDTTGTSLLSTAHLDAVTTVFGDDCRRCAALPHCSGVSVAYAERYGLDELVAFARPDLPWWL